METKRQRFKEDEAFFETWGFGELFTDIDVTRPPDIVVSVRSLGAPIKVYFDCQKAPHFDWDNAGPRLVAMVDALLKVRS